MHLLMSQPTLRAVFTTTLLLLLASLSACTYESSSLAGLICEDEGRREGDRSCKDGVWVVQAVADLPVFDMPDPVDMPDAPDLVDDMPDLSCTPEENVLFCLRLGASCGSVTALDNCGAMRSVAECGPCTGEGESCVDNSCAACERESDPAFCLRLGKRCGLVSAADNCADARENVDCGSCGAGEMCEDNQCVCQPEDDMTYCGRLGKQCGIVAQGNDNCGASRPNVDCGPCGQGNCLPNNTCSICQAETAAAFCSRTGAICGSKTALDNCGMMRTEQCGGCGAGETCTASNTCVCPEPMCPAGAECGTFINACGRPSQSCGSCGGGEVCNASNMCVCPTPVCPANAQCGAVTNACGGSVRCGANNGDCAAGLTCTGNACVCQAETAAAFCARTGATCGSKTAMDNCGTMRTEQCGMCGAGLACTANACVCAPETDAAFCARLGAQCGSRSAADNCGTPRTVNNCGACMGALPVCALNQCIASCSPESDMTFCARTNAECGSKTAADNCGTLRTVAECGMCTNGEACTANQCECPTPTCGANDQCGSITNVCGNTVMCGDMGACSTAGLTCDPMARTCANIVLTAPAPNDNDNFGWSLALRGDLLIVGRPDADVGGQIDKGAVDVYHRNTTTNQWTHAQVLSPEDHTDMAQRGAADDYFGTAVAFDGTTLVVGAPQYNIGSGAYAGKGYVYTYTLSGNTFAFQQRLAPAMGGGNVNVSNDSRYGWSVAVSGARLLVGAPRDADGGSAVVWARTAMGVWQPQRRLRLDMNGGSRAAGDEFGFAVALDGSTALVGAPRRGPNATGAVAVFEQTNVATNEWTRRHTFNSGFAEGEQLGFSVALQGTRGAFGSPGANKAYVVEGLLSSRSTITLPYTASAAADRFGASMWLEGARLLVGAPGHTSSQGRASLFAFANNMWAQSAAITAPAGQSANDDMFGHAVCLSGTRAAISAPERASSGQTDAGVVFIYEYP